ncbi:kinase-like domain-containing protein [Scheffersomyces coipomensis]|uniref:kinase-like domain-containing protein n=1 Tax=Scheffersomyces coipomensis TaxID=1788519 RepID=UPI00315D2015
MHICNCIELQICLSTENSKITTLFQGQQTSEISTTDNITPKNTAVSDDSMEIPVEIQAKIDKLSPKQLKHLVKQYRKKEHQTTFESFYSILPPQDHSNLTLSELVNYAENSIKTKEYLKHRNLVQCYGLPSFKRSGKGGFGSIYKSTSPDKKKTYAIKLVPMAPLADVTSEQIMNEYFISSKLDPRYFSVGIDILASTIDERFFIIVQNFISGIDLSKAISTCKRFRDINFTLGIFKQITIALYYLNIGYDICHADLSLRNIMYNRKTKRIKIIDFGMSLNMKTTPNHENLKRLLTRGSPGYVIRNSYTNFEDQKDYIDIGSSKDIFSLGHILFNLISAGELLWLDCEKDIRFNKYRKCSDNLISYWDRAQKLVCSKTYPIKKVMIYLRVLPTLKKMIDLDDTMRIDFITLVDSLWFKELPIYLTPKPTPVETVQSRPYSIKQSIKDALDILSMVASVGFVLYAVGYIF